MRKTAVTFEAVRALGRDFPDLHESTMYGSPALKLGKRLVACLAIHRSAEPRSLVVAPILNSALHSSPTIQQGTTLRTTT
jgi:hypothetical protein